MKKSLFFAALLSDVLTVLFPSVSISADIHQDIVCYTQPRPGDSTVIRVICNDRSGVNTQRYLRYFITKKYDDGSKDTSGLPPFVERVRKLALFFLRNAPGV